MLESSPEEKAERHKPFVGFALDWKEVGVWPTPRDRKREEQAGEAAFPHRAAYLPARKLWEHLAVFGGVNCGKTFWTLGVAANCLDHGYSLVVVDPKVKTLLRVLDACQADGGSRMIPPEDITLITPDPIAGGSVPGWNPLNDIRSPPTVVASAFVGLLHGLFENSWGPQLQNILRRAAQVIAAHGLSPLELHRFLTEEAFRNGLLTQPPRRVDTGYSEAVNFFNGEFRGWSRSERVSATKPVTNKLGDFLDSDFLRGLFCAPRNDIDLDTLWQRQQVLLVHLDDSQTEEGAAALLSGLFAASLLRSAMRQPGPHRVLLMVDELKYNANTIARSLSRIVAVARENGLHLLLATQSPTDLNQELYHSVMEVMGTRVWFKLGTKGAGDVAADLARTPYDGPTPPRKDDWYSLLRNLPPRHAVVSSDGLPNIVAYSPTCALDRPSEQYLRAVCAKNQSALQAEAAYAARQAEVTRIAMGTPQPKEHPTPPTPPAQKRPTTEATETTEQEKPARGEHYVGWE